MAATVEVSPDRPVLIDKFLENAIEVEADAIADGEIQLVINAPSGKASKQDDSYIRKTAVRRKVPHITTLAAGLAAAKGINAFHKGRGLFMSLQEYHAAIQ